VYGEVAITDLQCHCWFELSTRLYEVFDLALWLVTENHDRRSRRPPPNYFLRSNGGPLTRFPLRLTVTSTRSAILMNGMPLFMP
jgi:hypothetical protein